MTIIPQNYLKDTHPHLSKEFSTSNDKSFESLGRASGYRATWVCTKDLRHNWIATPASRFAGYGCPYCAGQRPVIGVNDLTTTHPEVAREWLGVNKRALDSVSRGSNYVAQWQCANGHQYSCSVVNRAVNNSGCPICSNKKVLRGYNDLATTHPQVLTEWDYSKNSISPHDVTFGSEKKVWWRCVLGHSWFASPNARSLNHEVPHGCFTCSKGHTSQIETRLRDAIRSVPALDVLDSNVIDLFWGKRSSMNVDVNAVTHSGRRVVVEFDGSYWHKPIIEVDCRKSLYLLDAGYTVVRVRDGDLPFLDLEHPNFYQIRYKPRSSLDPILGLVAELTK